MVCLRCLSALLHCDSQASLGIMWFQRCWGSSRAPVHMLGVEPPPKPHCVVLVCIPLTYPLGVSLEVHEGTGKPQAGAESA